MLHSCYFNIIFLYKDTKNFIGGNACLYSLRQSWQRSLSLALLKIEAYEPKQSMVVMRLPSSLCYNGKILLSQNAVDFKTVLLALCMGVRLCFGN